jgi:hypothetical protein
VPPPRAAATAPATPAPSPLQQPTCCHDASGSAAKDIVDYRLCLPSTKYTCHCCCRWCWRCATPATCHMHAAPAAAVTAAAAPAAAAPCTRPCGPSMQPPGRAAHRSAQRGTCRAISRTQQQVTCSKPVRGGISKPCRASSIRHMCCRLTHVPTLQLRHQV